MNEETKMESIDLSEFDFLPGAGAEDVITPTVLTNPKQVDIKIDENIDDDDEGEEGKEKNKEVNLDDVIPSLSPDDDNEGKDGSHKVYNNADIFKKLIEKKLIIPFEDDKPLEEYTEKDFIELMETNIEERSKDIEAKVQEEFFSSLPKELQMATKYVVDGGTDLQGLFRALLQSNQVQQLDANEPSHQEHIARAYLHATNFGTSEIIEDQIREWYENGTLEKRAKQFKPVIDKMQEEVVNKQLQEQEKFKQQQIEKRKAFIDNIANVLKVGELNGIKIDKKRQEMLFNEMTTTKYQARNGFPTNLFGKLLDDYQWGDKPRYDLIAEALWLLAEPEEYKKAIRESGKKEAAEETVRKLKMAQESGESNSSMPEDKSERRTIKRKQRNIFER
ncbi:MAG: hypothetical protein WAP54_04380 [Bacteroidales bacterium]